MACAYWYASLTTLVCQYQTTYMVKRISGFQYEWFQQYLWTDWKESIQHVDM